MERYNDSTELLTRILNAVEMDRRTHWTGTACAILLSLATLVSGWCLYQSSQWTGEQYFRIEDFNAADRKRLQMEIKITQRLAAESQIVVQYVSASVEGRAEVAAFLLERLPPHLKRAMLAWLETEPFNNQSAPRSPLQMEAYAPPETEQVAQHAQEAHEFRQAASESDVNADTYVLLSLLLAMVLFFSGLAGVAASHRLRVYLLGVALVVFLVTGGALLRMPIIL